MMFQRWLAPAFVCYVALQHGVANAEEGLTEASFNTKAAGRFAFLEFMTPNCKRCERLKPHWDRFMGVVKEEADVMVAAVDCNGAGKSLCDKHVKAKSYPVLMYGKVGDLKPYQGPQNYDGILDHFKMETNRTCLPTNQTWCSDDEKKQIEELLAMTPEQLDALQKEKTAKVEQVMQRFEKGVVRAENRKTETSGLWGEQTRRRVKTKESKASKKKAMPGKRPDTPFFADKKPFPKSAALDTTGPFSRASGMKPPFGANAGKGAGKGAAKGAGKGTRRTESPWKPGKAASKAAAKQERQALKDKTKSPAEKQHAMKEFRRQHAELKKTGSPEELRKLKEDFMKSQRQMPVEREQIKGDRKRKGSWPPSDSKRSGRMPAPGASQVDRLQQLRDLQLRKIGMDLVTAVIDHKQHLAEL